MLAFDSGNMSIQEYEQRYFYIFKMTDKTGSSNKSSSKAHTPTVACNQTNLIIWSKYYCNSTAKKKQILRPYQLKESVHQ